MNAAFATRSNSVAYAQPAAQAAGISNQVSKGRDGLVQRKCAGCAEEEEQVQRKTAGSYAQRKESSAGNGVSSATASGISNERGGGSPLPDRTKSFMESHFGADFSEVRIHNSGSASDLSKDLQANAFTVGNDIFFKEGMYSPDSGEGQRLLAHELTHTIQQKQGAQLVQRDGPGPRGGVSVNSPVIDETLVTVSDIHADIAGRALRSAERAVIEPVFGTSVDYSRIRLILGNVAARTTAGNNIRLPADFDINRDEHKQLLVHETTHVWQFQHNGAGYITTSLLQQMHAGASRGNRNFAYEYSIGPRNSFFEYAPEQQAFIVENYYAMQHDQAAIATPAGAARNNYQSNHLGADGFNRILTAAARSAEISAELPAHQRLITQMASTPFLNPQSLMLRRQENIMIRQPDIMGGIPTGGPTFAPTPSLLTIRFPGL